MSVKVLFIYVLTHQEYDPCKLISYICKNNDFESIWKEAEEIHSSKCML